MDIQVLYDYFGREDVRDRYMAVWQAEPPGFCLDMTEISIYEVNISNRGNIVIRARVFHNLFDPSGRLVADELAIKVRVTVDPRTNEVIDFPVCRRPKDKY